jgi:hypothetical protein
MLVLAGESSLFSSDTCEYGKFAVVFKVSDLKAGTKNNQNVVLICLLGRVTHI